MILIIQLVVIVVALIIVFNALISKQSYAARAWKKIALSLLAVAMVIAVLFPDITNIVANFLGIGRGADLLLYLVTIAFIGYTLNNYLHQQTDRDRLYRLARKIALVDANERYDIRNK